MYKIKIICTSYNNEMWCDTCISSLLSQSYKNFSVLYFDDASTDDTYNIVCNLTSNDDRFSVVKMPSNKTKSWIFANCLDGRIQDNEIVLFLDGDDWLASTEVLRKVNEFYMEHSPFVAYGGMVCWDGTDSVSTPNPQNSRFSNDVIINKSYRKDLWRSSHLKTMFGFVWNRIDKSNFISNVDENYILGPDDLVIMYDALESIPGYKIGVFDFMTYVYNMCPENSGRIKEHQTRRNVNYESEIRNRDVCSELKIVSSNLNGGLGNQLFQIAATVSVAKKCGYIPVFDLNTHFLPMQGNKARCYVDNIYRNLIFSSKLMFNSEFKQRGFNYEDIVLNGHTLITGGFQSEKFFDCNLVREIFSCPSSIESDINEKCGDILKMNTCSIHVRRGDYLKLKTCHPTCDIDYYKRAINKIPADIYLIFSDDINWCKSTFVGDKYVFVQEYDIYELYLMSKCKNNIIANSTFSWWGAWLNENTNKNVIAPKQWFGETYKDWDLSDLIPSKWSVI